MHILIMTGLTLPRLLDADLQAIREAAGPGTTLTLVEDEASALAEAPKAEIILGHPSQAVFAATTNLRWIQATASGIDGLLFPAFLESDVVLTSEKGLVGPHLADHAFALLLALARQIPATLADGRDSWAKRAGYRQVMFELEGQRLGIIGYGGTGRALAKRARGFDMTCRTVDLAAGPGDEWIDEVAPLSDLHNLLSQSDVVALCVPLTEQTQGFFNQECFAAMKAGSILLNVTRGEVVDQDAMIAALRSGQLAGAGLDVFEEEPLAEDSPLWDLPNVIMTPHTAGASQHRASRTLARFLRNMEHYRRGEPLEALVDKSAGF